MKSTFVLFGITGLAALGLSSVSFAQNNQEAQSKKTRHIKIMKMEDGKKIELDTALQADDVFVWKGDTINPAKRIKKFSPSEFDKMHHPDGDMDRQKKVKIYQRKGTKAGDSTSWKMESGDDVQIFSEQEGDSAQQKIIIHKRMKDGNEEDQLLYFNHHDGIHFPPMPTMPPMPHIRMMHGNHPEGSINLNDPNIISFKKKKMSGDREKIEIIRKISEDGDNMNFNFEMNDSMMVPEPPEPPEIENESGIDESSREEIREEIKREEENNTQTEEEVPKEETK